MRRKQKKNKVAFRVKKKILRLVITNNGLTCIYLQASIEKNYQNIDNRFWLVTLFTTAVAEKLRLERQVSHVKRAIETGLNIGMKMAKRHELRPFNYDMQCSKQNKNHHFT